MQQRHYLNKKTSRYLKLNFQCKQNTNSPLADGLCSTDDRAPLLLPRTHLCRDWVCIPRIGTSPLARPPRVRTPLLLAVPPLTRRLLPLFTKSKQKRNINHMQLTGCKKKTFKLVLDKAQVQRKNKLVCQNYFVKANQIPNKNKSKSLIHNKLATEQNGRGARKNLTVILPVRSVEGRM